MGQVLHGCARTTEAVRRAIQDSQESVRALAKRYGISTNTVQKWKKRRSVADCPILVNLRAEDAVIDRADQRRVRANRHRSEGGPNP